MRCRGCVASEGSESVGENPTAPSEEVKPVEEKQQEVKPEEPVTENKPADAGDKHGNPTGYNVAWSDWEY